MMDPNFLWHLIGFPLPPTSNEVLEGKRGGVAMVEGKGGDSAKGESPDSGQPNVSLILI
jgi:hypothetical protein